MEKIITISYKLESNEDVDKCDREIFETIKECGLMFHDGGYNTQNQMRDLRFKYESPESPKAMIAEGLEVLKGNGGLIHLADKVNKRLREIESHHTIQPYIFYALLEVCKQDKPKGGK